MRTTIPYGGLSYANLGTRDLRLTRGSSYVSAIAYDYGPRLYARANMHNTATHSVRHVLLEP